MKQKVLVWLLSVCMVLTMMPLPAFATGTDTGNVAEVNGTQYTSLQEAINAAQNGDTVTLINDIDLTSTAKAVIDDSYDTFFIVEGKTITVDMKGKTISGEYVDPVNTMLVGVFSTDNNGHLTITGNGTVDVNANGNKVYSLIANYEDGCSITIKNGTYKLDEAMDSLLYTGANEGIIVDDGTFELGNVGVGENGKPWIFNVLGANERHVVVNGGTFNADINHQSWAHEVDVPKNLALKNNGDGTWTTVSAVAYVKEKVGNYYREVGYATLEEAAAAAKNAAGYEVVALVNGEGYETITEAVAAANAVTFEEGATIELLTDVEIDAKVVVTGNVTIDGNGKTITWADGYTETLFDVASGASLNIVDATIDGENAFTFYEDTTAVENGKNWYTRFVNVGDEDKAVNANVFVNAGKLTLGGGTKLQNVTIASDGDNGKTANTETGGYYLMYNDDLALIKSNGGKVSLNGATISGNAGMVLNAINAETAIEGTTIKNNMGCGNKGGIIIANGGKMSLDKETAITNNKAMARSATILGVIGGAEVTSEATINNNKHLGVGSNTAGAIVVLEGASQFVMNGGSISNNVGGRAGAIASRWAEKTAMIELNSGEIKGNTAINDSWNESSVFLRSPATIGEGMTIEGSIAVNAAPGELEITGGTFTGSLTVADGLTAEITGGTFNYDPSEWCAEGFKAKSDNGTWTVSDAYVAQVGDVKYKNLKKAIEACTNGETVKLLDDITYLEKDVRDAIGGATGFGQYPNPCIIDIGGTRDAEADVNSPSSVNAVIDLNGHTITNTANAFTFLIMDNAKLTFTDSSDDKSGKVINTSEMPVLWVVGTDTLVTIEEGYYETANDEGLIHVTHGGDLVINGGEFKTTANDASLLIMQNSKDRQNSKYFISGKATVTITGGTFHGFNPSEVQDDVTGEPPFAIVNGVPVGYYDQSVNENGVYTVVDVNKSTDKTWVIDNKAELLKFAETANSGKNFAGITVKLAADIDLGGDSWTPITKFGGTFDGNNKTISNFKIDATTSHAGFFNVLEWANVYDLTLSDVEAKVGNYRYGTLARSINQTNVDNITVKNVKVTTTNSAGFVAGLVCHGTVNSNMELNNCTVENITVYAEMGAMLIGGILDFVQKNGTEAEGTNIFENLQVNNFKVIANDTDGYCNIGGLFGQTQSVWQNPRLNNCHVSGLDVTATGTVNVGGMICCPGSYTYAEDCTTEGKIDVTGVTGTGCYAGGFLGDAGWGDNVGKGDHKFTNCSADVNIITKEAAAGGFIGSVTNSENRNKQANFVNCVANGDITCVEDGTADIGGFAGYADRGAYTDCSATGTVVNNGTGYAGQFIGAVVNGYPVTIADCVYTGEATSLKFIGNQADDADVTIKTSVAKIGDVKYATLQAAIDAAVDGDTITVINDINYDAEDSIALSDENVTFAKVSGKKITIDLNGKKLYGDVTNLEDTKQLTGLISVTDAGDLTIIDNAGEAVVEVNTDKQNVKGVLLTYDTESKMTVNDGEYLLNIGQKGSGLIYSSGDETVTINGGVYKLENVGDLANGSPWIFNASGQNTSNIIVNGGSFNDDINHQYYPFEVVVPVEKAVEYNEEDGMWHIVDSVAYVTEYEWSSAWYNHEVGYATIDEAVEAAEKYDSKYDKHNETVSLVLTKDAISESVVYVFENTVLDLNGNVLTAKYVSSFGDIVDSSDDNAGILKVDSKRIMLQKDNLQVPVKNGEGYKFYSLRNFKAAMSGNTYNFLPYFDLDSHELLVSGTSITGVNVIVRATWGADGDIRTQDFIYSDTLVNKVINSYGTNPDKPTSYADMFTLTINNAGSYANLDMEAMVISDTGVEIPVSRFNATN